MKGFSLKNDCLEIAHKPSLKVNEFATVLTEKAKCKYDMVTIAVGSSINNKGISAANMAKNMNEILHMAESLSTGGAVQVSSIPPCSNDPENQDRIESWNKEIENISSRNKVEFISNDAGFRLGDGELNTCFFDDDGLHLSKAGAAKWMRNLKLQNYAEANMWEPARKRHRSQGNNSGANKDKNKIIKDNNKNTNKYSNQERNPCWNCGLSNHTSSLCRFKTRLTCHKCGAKGHKTYNCAKHQ